MPTYIRLARLTDRGVEDLRNLDKMVGEARRIFEANGCRVEHMWATLGAYDFIAVVEAPTEKIMLKASAEVASTGKFRAETLPAIAVKDFAAAVHRK